MTPPSQRLRVLHVLPTFYVGGAEQMAAHLMAGLAESWEVAGVSLCAATDSPLEHRLRDAGVSLWHLSKHPGFDPHMFPGLDRVFRAVRPHVVHTHMSVLRYALPGILRQRVPVVVHTLHNLAEHETDIFGQFVHWFAFRGRVLPIAISHKVAASVRRRYRLECHAIVPNAIPVDKYRGSAADRIRWRAKEGFAPDAFLYTCVGRLEPQKNPKLLLEAFRAINHPNAHLILMGQGSLRPELESYIRQHQLESRVHLLGKRGDVARCLGASDVFVLSSDWEGNPLAVMEAMAAGLPVACTGVGGVPELVETGRHGIVVPPGDAAALADAMRVLMSDPNQRAAMGAAALARAREAFDVPQMVRGYDAVYRTALAEAAALPTAAALQTSGVTLE